MFQTDLLAIIKSLNTVFTAIGICHTSYVECLLTRSGWKRYCSIIIHRYTSGPYILMFHISALDSNFYKSCLEKISLSNNLHIL
jgi:hypothetical protein